MLGENIDRPRQAGKRNDDLLYGCFGVVPAQSRPSAPRPKSAYNL
jgi:hypothetical protein